MCIVTVTLDKYIIQNIYFLEVYLNCHCLSVSFLSNFFQQSVGSV